MKTYCFECKHDCHCGRKCDHCSCYICNNILIKTYEDYMGGNMIKKVKQMAEHYWMDHKVEVAIFAILVVSLIIK